MRVPAARVTARAMSALAIAVLVVFLLGVAAGHIASSAEITASHRQTAGRGQSKSASSLHGRVVSLLTGEPIAGAKVEAGGLTTRTDGAGHFRLFLPPGVYDIHAAAPGYIGMTLLGQHVRLFNPPGIQLDRQPPLLFEMVPAHPSEADAALLDRKLLPRRTATGPSLHALQPAVDFRQDVEALPRTIRVLMPEGTIVTLDIDQYLRGVVPAEIGPYRPLEALKAQAVAARSYAATRCLPDSAGDPEVCEPGLDANVDTTVRTQVYDPVRRYDTTDEAVLETHGVVPRYEGRLIEALFFAHSDGRTRNSEDSGWDPRPYLRSVADPVPFDFMYGHGVGLSQIGASVFADWGAGFDELVRYYYRGVTVAPPQPPTLTGPTVSPVPADSRTPIRFEITYADPEGDPPVAADVYINGRAYPMRFLDGDLRTGARFAYTTTLQAGAHTYEFHFSDGFTRAVSAEGGTLKVTAGTGPIPTSTPTDDATRSGQWRHSSRLDWLDGELNGLTVTEDTDASLILSEDTTAATYTSVVLKADFPFIAVGANWQAELPRDTEHGRTTLDIRVQTSPDGTAWSDWVSLPPGDGGRWLPLDQWSELAFVGGRFLRYRVTLTSPEPKLLRPRLDGITLTYIYAPAGPLTQRTSKPASHTEPEIIPREEWCDSTCRYPTNWPPEYETPVKFIIHHTVSPNDQDDSYQAVRAIYHYHADTRGWDDIGYNYLIDNQGRVFEGRYGGENDDGQTVVGGHALQYNYGSIGIALIGTYSEVEPPPATVDTLADLLITLGLRYDIGPYDQGPLAGTDFEYGVLGHRDVLPGHTVCPGQAAWELLPDIRARVDAGMAQHEGRETATPSVTPSATATRPPGCYDRVANGDFEQGEAGWWSLNRAYFTEQAHGGNQALFIGLLFDDPDQRAYASAQQSITIPIDATTANLAYWYMTVANGDTGDQFLVRIFDSGGAVLFARNLPADAGGWQAASEDLTEVLLEHTGETVRLYFGVYNDGDPAGEKSYMRLDDVSLVICQGGVTATSTVTSVATGTPTVTPTMTETPTSVATGTAPVTLTPTFTGTPTPSPTLTPLPPTRTPTPTATPTELPTTLMCVDLIGNPGFEDGEAFWTIPSTDYPARIVTERARSGEHSALVGIVDPQEDVYSYSSVWQDVFVPADAVSATFAYWYYPVSLDPEDRQIVEVREPNNENRNRLKGFAGDTSDEQTWLSDSFDLSEHYPGKTVRLYFSAFNRNQGTNPGGVTAMYVDDVSLMVCRPPSEQSYLPLIRR